MIWTVYLSSEFTGWYRRLSNDLQERVAARIELLQQHGPALGRPVVDTIKSSRHKNMKELRVGSVRALFAFDHGRRAVLLVGGSKAGRWDRWYSDMVPRADMMMDEYLAWRRAPRLDRPDSGYTRWTGDEGGRP